MENFTKEYYYLEIEKLSKKLSGNVSRETFSDLCIYAEIILEWQYKMNLIAKADLKKIWERHILDSAQLFLYGEYAEHWLDLGSGAGFPGIVLAILLKGSGQGRIDLVEANHKKSAFLQMMVAKLSLPARIHTTRIETMDADLFQFDRITARAVAPLKELFSLIEPFMRDKTIALLPKGKNHFQEIHESMVKWSFDSQLYQSKFNEASVILAVRNLKLLIR